MKMNMKNVMNLNGLSRENLKMVQRILKITLDELELQGINRISGNMIPLKIFEREGFCYDEVEAVLNKLDCIEIRNNELKKQFEESERSRVHFPSDSAIENYDYFGISRKNLEEDLRNYLFVVVNNLDELKNLKQSEETAQYLTDSYKISVKDREIWINDYLIGKPHAVGSNFEFFEYIRFQAPHKKINRSELPSKFGDLSIQGQIKNKSFIKILNELGFKGEILKAFFYKRGKDTLVYRGDEITKEDLEKAGVKTSLFLKELELANIKNSPE